MLNIIKTILRGRFFPQDSILELKLGELTPFSAYSHGRLDFKPLNKDIGRYYVQARLVEKRTQKVLAVSAF